MKYKKYTKQFIQEAVDNSISYNDVLRYTGRKLSGGNSSHIKQVIKKFDIDITHFLGKSHNKGRIPHNKKEPVDVLIFRPDSDRRQSRSILKRSLLAIGRSYECELCGSSDVWNGGELILQIDHIDGNWLNDTEMNLRFLCPNCHSQTDNFSGRCVRDTVEKRPKTKNTNMCIDCGVTISIKSLRCKSCNQLNINKSITKRPSKPILELELKSLPLTKIGLKYGVSDNSVRKWCNFYELPYTKTDIIEFFAGD